ncbi:MAG: cupin domain-containing protein [Solirubrobacteraceae bacterium]
MPDYTLVNFSDAEDMAASHGLSPQLESRFLRQHLDSEHLGVSFFKVAPDFRTPFGHKHSVQEEAYVIVAGSGRFKLDDDIVEVKQGDVLRVAPSVMRAFESGPDGVEIVAIGSDRPPDGDGEMQPNWWTDQA